MADRMSPDESPKAMVRNIKVKRANRWPVLIGVGLLMVIGWITITVSQHRAELQRIRERERPAVVTTDRAEEIIGDRDLAWVPPHEEPEPAPVTPPPPVEPPAPEPPPPVDIVGKHRDRIREQQLQVLEQAAQSPLIPDMAKSRSPDRRQQMLSMINETQRGIDAAQRQIFLANNPTNRLVGMGSDGPAALDDYGGAVRGGESRALSDYDKLATDGMWDTGTGREMAKTPYELKTGWVVPAKLMTAINSDLQGPVVARVSRNVCDSATGNHVLIPAGTMLFGNYSNEIETGQNRVMVAINRIVFGDSSTIDIGSMPVVDSEGYAGMRDKVDNKFPQIFGRAILMSAIIAGVSMSQNNQNYKEGGNRQRASDALSESVGQSLGTALSEVIKKNLNISPTITIRDGYEFNLVLTKDIIFMEPYIPHSPSNYALVRR